MLGWVEEEAWEDGSRSRVEVKLGVWVKVGKGVELGVWVQEEVGLGVQVGVKLGVRVGFGVEGS